MCGLSYKALDDIHWIFTTAYTYISGSSESFLFRLDAFSRYILFFKVVNDIQNPTIIFNSYLQKDALSCALSLYRVDSKILTRCLRVFHL